MMLNLVIWFLWLQVNMGLIIVITEYQCSVGSLGQFSENSQIMFPILLSLYLVLCTGFIYSMLLVINE
jgi:DMSO reductase anchor subunit